MKKLSILLLPFLLSWQSEDFSHLTGNIQLPEQSTLLQIDINGSDTTFNLKTDPSNNFSVRFANHRNPIYMITGKIKLADGNRWEFATPIYIKQKAKTNAQLQVKNSKIYLLSEDPNNQAIQEYEKFYQRSTQAAWTRTPQPSQLKESAGLQIKRAEEIIEKYKPDAYIADFLTTWGYLGYVNIVNAAKQNYKYMGLKLPEDIYKGFPELPQLLDKPYWNIIGGTSFRIAEYIKTRAKTPEEQIAFLKDHFTTHSIIVDQTNQVISSFLFNFRYNEENYKRLEALTEGLPDQKNILENYKKTRFAKTGTGGTGRTGTGTGTGGTGTRTK